jgi:uncharacterized protein YrzB (UPF0473 family)
MGAQPVNPTKAARLLDFYIWNSLGDSENDNGNAVVVDAIADEDGEVTLLSVDVEEDSSTGGPLRLLTEDRKMARDLVKEMIRRIAADRKARKAAGLPLDFVPDLLNSIHYTPSQVQAHIRAVCDVNYISQGLESPKIHFICLQEDGKTPAKEVLRDLRGLTEPYNGAVRLIDGSDMVR